MPIVVYREPLYKLYVAPLISPASIFKAILVLADIIFAFLIAYSTQGLWITESSVYITPTVTFANDYYVTLLDSADSTPYVFSSFSSVNALLADNVRQGTLRVAAAPPLLTLKVLKSDADGDGAIESYTVTIDVTLPPGRAIGSINAILWFEYNVTVNHLPPTILSAPHLQFRVCHKSLDTTPLLHLTYYPLLLRFCVTALMAEWSKALRSGRSLVLQAWVQIPLNATFFSSFSPNPPPPPGPPQILRHIPRLHLRLHLRPLQRPHPRRRPPPQPAHPLPLRRPQARRRPPHPPQRRAVACGRYVPCAGKGCHRC
jgi:hypothetical protein